MYIFRKLRLFTEAMAESNWRSGVARQTTVQCQWWISQLPLKKPENTLNGVSSNFKLFLKWSQHQLLPAKNHRTISIMLSTITATLTSDCKIMYGWWEGCALRGSPSFSLSLNCQLRIWGSWQSYSLKVSMRINLSNASWILDTSQISVSAMYFWWAIVIRHWPSADVQYAAFYTGSSRKEAWERLASCMKLIAWSQLQSGARWGCVDG